MCAVSAMSDYYLKTWPKRNPLNPKPWTQNEEIRKDLQKVLKKLDEIDKKLQDVECLDEEKQTFLSEINYSPTISSISSNTMYHWGA